jgi:hypothetical protein
MTHLYDKQGLEGLTQQVIDLVVQEDSNEESEAETHVADEGKTSQDRKKKKKRKPKRKTVRCCIYHCGVCSPNQKSDPAEDGGAPPPEIAPTPRNETAEEKERWERELIRGARTYELPYMLLDETVGGRAEFNESFTTSPSMIKRWSSSNLTDQCRLDLVYRSFEHQDAFVSS